MSSITWADPRLFLRVVLLCLLAVCPALAGEDGTPLDLPREPLTVVAADGTLHAFDVQVARTIPQRQTGLMFRRNMPDTEGMLFPFPRARHASFWMKNTRIPLDMLFVDGRGRIAYIERQAQPGDLTPRGPAFPVIAVLELNGGLAATLGIAVGDRVYHADLPTGPWSHAVQE